MDYEKKYKNALELAKDYFKANQKLGELEENDMLSDIFPELKESEDERIRKAIVATIHLYYGEPLEDEAKEMIAWIEKQEQKPTDEEMKTLLRIEYEKGRADAIAEMQKPVDCIDCTNSKGCINCKDGNMKETLVRKPAWSEEDEEFLRRAINATKDVYPMTAKWLKFLKDRVQPKQEWSKKDNQYLCGLIGLIEQSKAELPITLKGKAADNCIDWLKSLKPQNRWKPSEKQMEALKNAIHIKPYENPSDSLLWGLYEQLKTLKEY